MTKPIILFAAMLLFAAASHAQDNITAEGKIFRTAVKKFLTEEGFSPTIDEEYNSLDFKKEGSGYWFYFYGSSPIYVRMFIGGTNCATYEETDLLKAANQTNIAQRAVKCFVNDKKVVSFASEYYVNSLEDFKYTFYSNMEALEQTRKAFSQKLDEVMGVSSDDDELSLPFIITTVSVGNTNQKGEVITDYGLTIYSTVTQYIKPRLSIDTYKEGTYDIYVKFYNADGLLSTANGESPSGYTYKSTITLTKNVSQYDVSGWGGTTSGHWKSGQYRLEFYYKDQLLFTKKFNVL